MHVIRTVLLLNRSEYECDHAVSHERNEVTSSKRLFVFAVGHWNKTVDTWRPVRESNPCRSR